MSLFCAEMSRTASILIVGDAMVDRYITGEVTRVSPEAPVPVLLTRSETMRAGGAANVAANVAALGGRCSLLCVAGDDRGRDDLKTLLASAAINLHLVVDPHNPTTEKTRLVSGTQQIARIDRDGSASSSAENTDAMTESNALVNRWMNGSSW